MKATTLAIALAAFGCNEPAETEQPEQPPSFLLISIDTTRADRLGSYGFAPTTTPNIDAWASKGVVFENALTPVPITLPAHTSMLTGLLPYRHGARDNGTYRVPDDIPTIASRLSEEGYDTAAIVAAAVLDRQYGLDRGFARYDDAPSRGAGLAIAERDARAVTDAAVAMAGELNPPFFFFVHYFDPHAAYAPPPPFAERFRSNPYQGELAFVDDQIGRLRRELDSRGLLNDTVVVLTSDHGEGLGEHHEATHGVFLYQSTLHVPLIVVAPERWPAGERVGALVSLTDIAPTLYEFAGASAPPDLDGSSLGRLVTSDARAPARWLPLESEFGFNSYGWAPLVGITDGRWKWVGAPRAELYDLSEDPREMHNLAPTHSGDVGRLSSRYRETAAEDRRGGALDDPSRQAQSQRLAELRSLGYVAGSRADASSTSKLVDPKDGIATLDAINDARRLMGQGRYGEATSMLENVTAVSPRNVSALVLTGAAYIMNGDPQRALDPLEAAERVSPNNADVHFNLGLAWLGVSRPDRAESAWRRTLELQPRHGQAAVNVIDLLIRTDRPSEAETILRTVRDTGLASPLLDYLEGKLRILQNDRDAARASLERALAGSLPQPVADDARELLKAIEN